MSAKLELGHEQYTVDQGKVTADVDDEVQQAQAEYFTTIAPTWLDRAQRDGVLDYYIPDMDCALAKLIAQHMHGRWGCQPMPAPPRGAKG